MENKAEEAGRRIEEIIRGESPNVEFKLALPKDSEKYVKTIIAFANTQGGQLMRMYFNPPSEMGRME